MHKDSKPNPAVCALPHWLTVAVGISLPQTFKYTEESPGLLTNSHPNINSCECQGDCVIASCKCVQRNPLGQLLDKDRRLVTLLHGIEYEASVEVCGPTCACDGQCSNSVSVRKTRHALIIAPSLRTGLGVFARSDIHRAEFIGLYSGEYLSAEEAKRRLDGYDRSAQAHALLVVREVLPSGAAALTTQIDATNRGNIARFINHSCDGGNMEAVTVRRPGDIMPRVAMFAKRDIRAGEELLYSYGLPYAGPGRHTCCCGSAECKGFLPHESM